MVPSYHLNVNALTVVGLAEEVDLVMVVVDEVEVGMAWGLVAMDAVVMAWMCE